MPFWVRGKNRPFPYTKGVIVNSDSMNKLFILGLCLLCGIVYFNSLNNDFVFDDNALILNNNFIKSLKFLPLIFKKSLSAYSSAITTMPYDKRYRPLQLLTYNIDYKLWKFNPLGYHLTNVLLHLLNSILVYYLLLIIFNNSTFSKIVSILFLVCPIHTSVVSYISGRADLLVSLFMLLSIIFLYKFIKLKFKRYYAISLLCAAFALLSRENALLLFLFILLLLFILRLKLKYYLYATPFMALSISYLVLRVFIFGQRAIVMHPAFLTLPLRVINFFSIIPRYLLLLVLPLDLHMFRSMPFIKNLLDIRAFFAILFILFYFIMILRFRKNKLLLFGMFWFLIGIIPVFFYVDAYAFLNEAMMAESWLYVSSIGFFIVFIFILNRFKHLGKVLILFIIVFYGFLTKVNNLHWINDYSLVKNILKYSSGKDFMRINLVHYYLTNGFHEDALEEIKKFSNYHPDSLYLYCLWGDYYLVIGELDKAVDNYIRALGKNKKSPFLYYKLSLCYEGLGQPDSAIDSALECFKADPHYVPNLIKIGDLYSMKRQFAEAKKYYHLALELDSDNQLLKEKITDAE